MNTRQWVQLVPSGIVPSARTYHCLVWDSINSRLILFGGHDTFGNLNDLWKYPVSTNKWTKEVPTTGTTTSRAFHACTINTQTGTFYIHGGSDGVNPFALSDLTQYDFTAK